MNTQTKLLNNRKNVILKQYKLNAAKDRLKKKDSKVSSIIYCNNDNDNVLITYNNGLCKKATSLNDTKNATATTISSDGKRLSSIQVNKMFPECRCAWSYDEKVYVVKPGVIFEVSGCGDGKSNGVDTLVQDVAGFTITDETKRDFIVNLKDDYNFYQTNFSNVKKAVLMNFYVQRNNVTQFNLQVGIGFKVNTIGETWKFNENYVPTQSQLFKDRGFNSSSTHCDQELYTTSLNNNEKNNKYDTKLLNIISNFTNIKQDQIYLFETYRNVTDNDHLYAFNENSWKSSDFLFFVTKRYSSNVGKFLYMQSNSNKIYKYNKPISYFKNVLYLSSYFYLSDINWIYDNTQTSIKQKFLNNNLATPKSKQNIETEKLRIRYYDLIPQKPASKNHQNQVRLYGGGGFDRITRLN